VVDDVPSVHLDLQLPAEAASVARARHLLEGVPGLGSHAALMLDMRLAMSEMVTNSILHGSAGRADEVEVVVDVDARRVRIEGSPTTAGGSTRQAAPTCRRRTAPPGAACTWSMR
jgi:anti-sigma regulatory factor (Ser/Thr protein kinase)